MNDARHHHAVQIVFVETPAAGSNEPMRQVKPRYPQHSQPRPWRPATRPPSKQRQAENIVRVMRELERRTADASKMLHPNAALWQAWVTRGAA